MRQTLPQMVLERARQFGGRRVFRRKEGDVYQDISWDQLAEGIHAFGRGLVALGVRPGDRVAIMAPNSPEWVYSDLGAMACRAVSVPVYHTEGIPAVTHIVNDSQSRVLFIHTPLVAEELIPHLEEMPRLEQIVLLESHFEHSAIMSHKQFLEAAEGIDPGNLEALLTQGEGDELASLVYTSGTTGPPKGVMLSHQNFLSNVEACVGMFDIGPDDQSLSFLPLSHVFERMAGYYLVLYQGGVIAYAENLERLPVNLAEVQPTMLISVPRLYEKMYARIMERVLDGPWLSKQLFFSGLKAGKALVKAELEGRQPSFWLRLASSAARKIVFSKLRDRLGGRLRFFVSGGAPLARELAEFYFAAGLPIYEGYGLTETSPVIAANCPRAVRFGTVGRAIPGTRVKIAADGEILASGPGVSKGYWNRPEETEHAFGAGWFKTGDVGQIDEEGFLSITDRKKDLIVTASGENIAPQNLENLFKTNKYLANALVYGDQKPFLTALLVPNLENLEKFAHQEKIDYLNHCDLVNHPQVLALIRQQIDGLQKELPSFQRIKRFTLLSADFGKEMLTPTLKLRRKIVKQMFHEQLEGMYLAEGHGIHDSGFCILENPDEGP